MISVIIPTYNRAATLGKAAQSVLDQTYKEIELLIIDDGSTDNTEEVVESLNDERVRYIKLKKNMGACVARNVGIEESRGEYVAFQDSDDLWYPNKLEHEFAFLVQERADVVCCTMHRYYSMQAKPTEVPCIDEQCKKIEYTNLLKDNVVSTSTVFCKKACVLNVRFDETLPRLQDWDWALRVSQRYSLKYLNEVLVDSYVQDDSISRYPKRLARALRIIYEKYRGDIEQNPELCNLWIGKFTHASFLAGELTAKEGFEAFKATKEIKLLIKAAICAFGLQPVYLRVKKLKVNNE